MRRVKKEEVKLDHWIKPDGLAYCLDCWAAWMLSDDRDLSASRMRLHGGADDRGHEGYEHDVYAEQRKADFKIGEATNAMIDGLKPAHRWAIYRRCNITTQWSFRQLDFTQVLVDAEEVLGQKLRQNIATATLF